jgi:hypothetical protein
MPQNLLLKLIQSLFLINDGKSEAFVPQNSNGATDGRRTTDRPSYPNLLRSQMGYIVQDQLIRPPWQIAQHPRLLGLTPAIKGKKEIVRRKVCSMYVNKI